MKYKHINVYNFVCTSQLDNFLVISNEALNTQQLFNLY